MTSKITIRYSGRHVTIEVDEEVYGEMLLNDLARYLPPHGSRSGGSMTYIAAPGEARELIHGLASRAISPGCDVSLRLLEGVEFDGDLSVAGRFYAELPIMVARWHAGSVTTEGVHYRFVDMGAVAHGLWPTRDIPDINGDPHEHHRDLLAAEAGRLRRLR